MVRKLHDDAIDYLLSTTSTRNGGPGATSVVAHLFDSSEAGETTSDTGAFIAGPSAMKDSR
jgi:hypothetical protein